MQHTARFSIALVLILAASASAQEALWTYKAPAGHLDGSPAIVDINGDGKNEVVLAATSGEVTALDGNGAALWSKMLESPISVTPTAVNVVGEPTPEVLLLNNHGVLYCLDGQSGAEVWRQQLAAGVEWGMTAIVAVDLEQDGQVEIITGDERGTVVCYSGDGRLLWSYDGQQGSTKCPAVGDLGFGPEAEIVVSGKTGRVVCLSDEGKAQWECEGAGPASSPVIADITDDADNEVVVAQGAKLIALDKAGAKLWSAPMKREVDSALTCADMDGDGKAEVFAVDITGYMACVAGDGSVKWTASVEERARRSPSVADVDGDGALEVLVAGYSGAIHVFSQDGYLKQRVALSGASNSTATVADLAGDGTPVVLCTSANLLTALRWPGAKPGAAVLWPEYRSDASRSACPSNNAGKSQVLIAEFDEGDCYVGTNEFRIAVDNASGSEASVELEVLLYRRPLAHAAFPCESGKHRYETAYILDGRETANLEFIAKVVSGDKTLAVRNRSLFVVPFRKELADLESLFESITVGIPKLADPSGLEERAYFLQHRLPDLAKRVADAGTVSDAKRRALRDELASLLDEVRGIRGLVNHAARLTADGRTLVASRANPWAPFGGVDEIHEGRLLEPSLDVEAFAGEHEVAALNVINLAGEAAYARVEIAPFKCESAGEIPEVPARGVVRLHEAVPVATQVLDMSADAVPAMNQGDVLLTPAWDGRQLWLDVDTKALAPGTWTSELKIRTLAVKRIEITVPVKVTVWNAALPEKQALRLCHWGYVHSSILKDQPDSALQDQLDLGTNVFVGVFYPKATFDADGEPRRRD